jgi:hypothetical protein
VHRNPLPSKDRLIASASIYKLDYI